MMTKSGWPDRSFSSIGLTSLIKGSKPAFEAGLPPLPRPLYIFLFNGFRLNAIITATGYTQLTIISLLRKKLSRKPLKASVAGLSKSLSHFTSTH